MANVTVLVRVVDATPNPVDGVLVRVFSDADVFITEGTTGSITPGEVEFTLNGDSPGVDYLLRLAKDGFSFPPAATKEITVNDPPIPANEFEYTAVDGETAKVVVIHVQDDQPVPVDVEGVKVWVYDDLDQYITESDTDADGNAEFTLPGAASPGQEHIVRLRKTGYSFPDGATQKFYVLDPVAPPDSNIFDFTAHALTIPESADPNMCTLSGYLVDGANQAVKNCTVRFLARHGYPEYELGMHYTGDPTIIDRNIIVADHSARTDDDGYLEISLPRGGLYDVHIHGARHPSGVISPIIVPDLAGCRLEDVLFPYVQTVVYGTDPIAVAVDGSAEVDLTVTLGSGVEACSSEDIRSLLEFSSDDPAVAEISLLDDKKMRVTGVSPGTTSVTVTRKVGTYAPRIPDIPALVVTPPTIEVT